MKDETLVKDLTVGELKDLIRQIVREELVFSNRNVTECKGWSIPPIKLPTKFEVKWAGESDFTAR